MNNVLLIDASPLFREFLKDKLSAEKVSVTVTQGKRDAFIKIDFNPPRSYHLRNRK